MEADSSRKFSPSKLDTYKNCPRRYQYRYVDAVKRRERSVEAYLGTMVHSVLEELYGGLQKGRRLSLEEGLKIFDRNWKKDWGDDIVIRDKDCEQADYKRLGRECLAAYYEANSPFDRDRTVEVEKRIGFPLEAGGVSYLIEGFIDRLSLAKDGAFEIHDYKTSRSLPTQEHVDSDWQLAIYDLAVRHAWPDTERVRLIWHYLRHGKALRSERGPEQRENLRSEVAALIIRIKADHEFIPRKSPLCDWCEYRDLCPLWKHSESLAALPQAQRRKEDGFRLAEQYSGLELRKKELREELKRLDREQEGLEPEILKFAQERGVSVVSCESGELAVSCKPDPRFPTRTMDPEGFAAMESELRSLPVWPDVSHVDPHLLLEGFEGRRWSDEILLKLEPVIKRFLKTGTKTTIRFHRKKESREDD